MQRVLIAMPAFGQTNCSQTTRSLMGLGKALMSAGYGYYFGTQSFPDIAELRNIFLSLWYDRLDASHMLMIDADMDFEPQLVLAMLAFDKPLVGCLYPKRTLPIEFVGRPLPGKPNYDGGFREMEGVGGGVMLIRRDCVDAMIASGAAKIDTRLQTHVSGPQLMEQGLTRIIKAFDKIEVETGTMAEDYSFCRRYRESGGQVWAATHHKVDHIGQFSYSGTFVDADRPDTQDYLRTKGCRHGTFMFNKNDSFIGASLNEYGEWCEYELDLLLPLLREGDTVVDVGANIGTHTVPFARAVGPGGHVYAFEPQPALYDILIRNVGANIASGVSIMREVVTDVVDPANPVVVLADLPDPRTHFNYGAVPAIGSGANTAITLRIDDLGLKSCRLIKVDVEGMEAQVIRGARDTIGRLHPILYIENNGPDSKAIAPVLEEIGYRAFWSIGPYFNPDNYNGSKTNLWPSVMPSVNLIAVPPATDFVLDGLPAFLGPEDNWHDAYKRRTTCQTARMLRESETSAATASAAARSSSASPTA